MKKLCFLFFILIFSLSEAKTFTDVKDYSWAASAIDEWSDRGIISGYIDGTFKGNNNLKRSEMITVINKLNNSSEVMKIKPSRDVDISDWYYNEMSIALKNGLIEVDEEFNLRPNDYATREEVFVILAKLFKLKYVGNSTESLKNKFSDYYLIAEENYPYIAALVNEGYINGYENKTLKPKSLITRAELIAIIDKIVEELYTVGEVKDKFINGNIIINGEGVLLNNVNVKGNIFIMDGARNDVPLLENIDTTKGIISRIGDVFVTKKVYDKLTEEKEIIEPVFIKVKYSDEDWTNEDVTVTLSFNDKDYEVINNSGKNKYKFDENGEFTFIVGNSKGDITKFTAKVNNIDKVMPKFEVVQNSQSDKDIITLTIEDDGMSPIAGAYFLKGSNSEGKTIRYGTEIINNSFDAFEKGKYTIVVKDEAGNKTRKIINVKLTSHIHKFSKATCTVPEKCTCGETNGTALGHDNEVICDLNNSTDTIKCKRCGETGSQQCSHIVN